ncbi:MAG: hypothetical protein Q4B13_01535 [Lautropia sp.]|nr:hypothetical protein [Lautropia sp.]
MDQPESSCLNSYVVCDRRVVLPALEVALQAMSGLGGLLVDGMPPRPGVVDFPYASIAHVA